jgi:EmrB/QacA subfamily drug resistance transporter
MVLVATQFLNIVNLSSVSIALPDIAEDLGLSDANLPWVMSAYGMTFAGFLLVGGRAADVLGRRKVLAFGFAVFGLAAALAAVSTTPLLFVVARALQGVGAATMIPASLGILTTAFPDRGERSKALAEFAAGGAVGFATGLLLGGAVTGALGWRWVFVLTVPPCVVLLVLTFVLVRPESDEDKADGRVDVPGALTATAGLLALTFGFTNAGKEGWLAPATLAALAVGVALLGLFLRLQARADDPLMPLGVWRRPNFAAILGIGVCLYAAWTSVIYYLALLLQRVLGYSPTGAAVALLPLAVGGLVGTTIVGRVLPKTGPKPVLVAGLSACAVGVGLMSLVAIDTRYWPFIFAVMVLAVLGNSASFVSANVTSSAGVDPDDQGLVSGLFFTSLMVGGSVGLAVVNAVAGSPAEGGSGEELLPSYQAAFRTACGFLVIGVIATIVFVRSASSKEDVVEEEAEA